MYKYIHTLCGATLPSKDLAKGKIILFQMNESKIDKGMLRDDKQLLSQGLAVSGLTGFASLEITVRW